MNRRRGAWLATALAVLLVAAPAAPIAAEGSGGSIDGSVSVAALVITEVVGPPNVPSAGDLTTITVRVRNDLQRAVHSLTVDTAGAVSAGATRTTIAAGQTLDVLVPVWFCTTGPTQFTVTAIALDGTSRVVAPPVAGQVDVAARPGCPHDPEVDGLPIRSSNSPDRSAPGPLDGRIVSGVAHVIVDPANPAVSGRRGIRRVEFRLDERRLRIDRAAPFDLAGNHRTSARGFDTTLLADGTHNVRTVVTFRDGSTQSFLAHFVVANGASAKTIQFSSAADRSAAQPLDGATLASGRVYIFIGPTTEISNASVSFLLDGRLSGFERAVPYDMGGTARNATARAVDLARLRRGIHTITVQFRLPSGITIIQKASFTRP